MNTNPKTPTKPLKLYIDNQTHRITNTPATFRAFIEQVILPLQASLPSSYTLKYRDQENDLITVSCEDDYTAMLQTQVEMPSQSIKVMVVSLGPEDSDWKAIQQEISIVSSASSEYERIEGNSNDKEEEKSNEEQSSYEIQLVDNQYNKSAKTEELKTESQTDGKSEEESKERGCLEDSDADLSSPKTKTVDGLSQISFQEEDQEKKSWSAGFSDKSGQDSDEEGLEKVEKVETPVTNPPLPILSTDARISYANFGEGAQEILYQEDEIRVTLLEEVGTLPATITTDATPIIKTIAIMNSGKKAWPKNLILRNIDGPRGEDYTQDWYGPGELMMCILVIDNPRKAGEYTSTWQLCYMDDNKEAQFVGEPFTVSFVVNATCARDFEEPPQKDYFDALLGKANKLKELFPEDDIDQLLMFAMEDPELTEEELVSRYMERCYNKYA